jgi:hypothetical protein
MILINRFYTLTGPEGDIIDTGQLMADQPIAFRELVEDMRNAVACSACPATGTNWEWFTLAEVKNYKTGTERAETFHLSRNNGPRSLKYWRLAMRVAGRL